MTWQKEDPVKRFWAFVEKRGDDDCWAWTGGTTADGYGRFWDGQQETGAHRYSYLIHKQDYDPSLLACHTCDNPTCVNPAHLFMATNAENTRDKMKKGRHRLTFPIRCRRGHFYDRENTYYYVENGRSQKRCKACVRMHVSAYKRRKSA